MSARIILFILSLCFGFNLQAQSETQPGTNTPPGSFAPDNTPAAGITATETQKCGEACRIHRSFRRTFSGYGQWLLTQPGSLQRLLGLQWIHLENNWLRSDKVELNLNLSLRESVIQEHIENVFATALRSDDPLTLKVALQFCQQAGFSQYCIAQGGPARLHKLAGDELYSHLLIAALQPDSTPPLRVMAATQQLGNPFYPLLRAQFDNAQAFLAHRAQQVHQRQNARSWSTAKYMLHYLLFGYSLAANPPHPSPVLLRHCAEAPQADELAICGQLAEQLARDAATLVDLGLSYTIAFSIANRLDSAQSKHTGLREQQHQLGVWAGDYSEVAQFCASVHRSAGGDIHQTARLLNNNLEYAFNSGEPAAWMLLAGARPDEFADNCHRGIDHLKSRAKPGFFPDLNYINNRHQNDERQQHP